MYDYSQVFTTALFWNFFVTKGLTQWIFNLSSLKSYCLTFTGIYFHPIFYCPLPPGVQILLQLFYVVFICDFPIYYTVVIEESNTWVSVPWNLFCYGLGLCIFRPRWDCKFQLSVCVYVCKALVLLGYCKTETVLSSEQYTAFITLRK